MCWPKYDQRKERTNIMTDITERATVIANITERATLMKNITERATIMTNITALKRKYKAFQAYLYGLNVLKKTYKKNRVNRK